MRLRRSSSPEWLRTLMQAYTKPPKFIDEIYQAWQPRQEEAKQADAKEAYPSEKRRRPTHEKHAPQRETRGGPVVPASLSQAAVADGPTATWRLMLKQMNIPPQVVSKYDWHVKRAERFGRVAKVDTSSHSYAVKQADISSDRIQFIQESLEFAASQGFNQFAPIILTDADEASVAMRGHNYYASKWIDGQTVNFANDRDVGKVAQALARFNERTRDFKPTSAAPPHQFNLRRLMKQRTNDLNTLLVEAERRPLPGRFEEVLKRLGPALRRDAEASLAAISDSVCETFLANERRHAGLCHLDVIPSNFILDASGRVHLIDFDLMAFGPRALDLSHLMRRSLQLQSWRSETAYVCFLQYNAIRTMTAAEYQIVHALLKFPYKAWRLVHTRYRQFEESEQVRWLEMYRDQEPRRQAFLEAFEKQIIHK